MGAAIAVNSVDLSYRRCVYCGLVFWFWCSTLLRGCCFVGLVVVV